MLSLRIVTTGAAVLALAAGSAWAQTATTAAPGKPLQLFQVIQQKDDTAVRPHHRARYVRKRVTKTRIANQTTGVAHHTYMQVQPEPGQTAATPLAATSPATTPVTAATLTATTAVAPANIWPAANVTVPGMQAPSSTLVPLAAPPAASNEPVAANQNEMLTARNDAVQVTPPSATQATPPDTAQFAPPDTPQEEAPPNAMQVAQANMASPTDVAADQPHDAANPAKTGNPITSWPVQRAMVATADPQNPNPVGSVSWIVHVLAALGATIAAGALAWVLINPLPARSYE